MSDITRFNGDYRGRCRVVRAGNMVWAVATAKEAGPGVAEQTRATLAKIADSLADAGTDLSHMVEATVYLTDMTRKAEMDAVWCEIVPDDGWPCRACVGVDLAPGDVVEIKACAVMP
jgi:enamine deaminase RidA (YjgF/YER057c/UK114 family)